MRRFFWLGLVLCAGQPQARAQDTFSIVAVDPATGEVGSAGASCIAGSIILSDVHPGVGAIHTQSFWNAANQNYARTLMNQGYSPEQIIDSLVENDAQGNPTIRQYGIIDLVAGGRSAAYTGVNCFDYKNHILGPTYAIAGNILMGQEILDLMETGFINTRGMLSDRMMGALQGANVPGADTRCLAAGTSSISAFIRVAKPEDTTGVLFLDLNVNNAPSGVEPIDSLQVLYDEWKLMVDVQRDHDGVPDGYALFQNYPNPFNPTTEIRYRITETGIVSLKVFDLFGREVETLVDETKSPGTYTFVWNTDRQGTGRRGYASGVYFYRLIAGGVVQTKRMVLLR